MSLYREAGGPRIASFAVTALAAVAIGALGGYLAGAGGEEEDASLTEAVEQLQQDVRPALNELELVMIEYGEAVRGGRVVAETEYQASVDHAERARDAVEGASQELELLSPAGLERARSSLDELAGMIESQVPADRVDAAVARADAAIRAAARI
jgi:hypothetical protein